MNNQDFYSKIVQTLSHIYEKKVVDDRLDSSKISEFDTMEIRPLFPHKEQPINIGQVEEGHYTCTDVCCNIRFGHYLCGTMDPGSKQLNKLGLGISLYMKFICYLIFFFFLATLLVAAPLYLFYNVSVQNNSLRLDLNSILYSSTIGTLTANLYQCNYAAVSNNINITASCNVGTISLRPPIYTNQSFESVEICYKQYANLNWNGSFISEQDPHYIPSVTTTSQCGDKQCDISINIPNTSNQSLFVMVGYQCLNPQYSVIYYTISNKVILLIVVGVDLFVVLMFLTCICLETKSQKKLISYFQNKEVSFEDFTLQIKGFRIGDDLLSTQISNFIALFNEHVNKKARSNITINKFKICENVENISAQYKKKQLFQHLFKKHYQKLLAEGKDPVKMTLAQFATSTDYTKLRRDIEKVFTEFKTYLDKTKRQPHSVFITFETPQMVEDILRICKKSCITGKSYLNIKNRQYKVKRAPRPDLIQWQNLNSFYFLRTLFSWFVTFCILVGSYLMIAAAQIGQKQLLNKFDFQLNCNLLFSQTEISTWDETLKVNNNWINCYCSNNLADVFNHSQCQSWLKNYSFYLFSPMFISLLIVIFNMVISFVFKKLSKFQKHSNICNQLYSYIIKRALLLILNAGFIIVIVNQKLTIDMKNPFFDFLFNGDYNDFNAAWYYGIGQVIIFTNLFNIVMPIFEVVIQSVIKCLLKLIDTKCCRKRTSMVNKQTYKNLYSGIPFPIQERYAEIISLVILTFAYNSVIPILNVVAMFSFMFQYLTDKVMMFFIYRKPPNYDQTLQRMVRKTLILCIIIHLIASVFLLHTDGVDISSGFNFDSMNINSNYSLKFIMTQIYIYPYLGLLAVIVIWIIFRHTLIRLFSCCSQRCQSRILNYTSVEKNALQVYDLFTDHQIHLLLKVNKMELINIQNQQDHYNFKKGVNQTLEALIMQSVVKIVINPQGEIEIPNDWQNLDSYKKILFEERAQLKKRCGQAIRVKLNGLPGYDPTFQKENNLVEVSRFQKVVNSYFNQQNYASVRSL